MPLPTSGPLSLTDIQTEFGGSNPIGLNEYYAGGGLVPSGTTGTYGAVPSSGQISIQNFYGTANTFAFNLTSGTDLNLRTQALAAGWNGSAIVLATIPGGNVIQASSTGAYALTINGSFPSGVTLVNNGTIEGRGGDGGAGGTGIYNNGATQAGFSGGNAGPGLLVSVAVTINNASGVISGGGGGGGGGGAAYNVQKASRCVGGGGGGGGIGVSSGGAGGGASGAITNAGGAPGGGGTLTTVGGGGGGGNISGSPVGGSGGSGGSYGSGGATGGTSSGLTTRGGGAGGAAGTCLSGNSNITWTAFGTRYGAIV